MLDCAAELAPSHVGQALREADPIGEVARHRLPSNRWRRYDQLDRIPDGLIVIGDAICSFNPVYGQGITIASLEALVLRDCLNEGQRNLAQRYFAATAKQIRVAWEMATTSDLALPEVEGTRTLSTRLTNLYTEGVLTAAEVDVVVAEQFWKVLNFVDPPGRLMQPALLARVAAANLRRLQSRFAA